MIDLHRPPVALFSDWGNNSEIIAAVAAAAALIASVFAVVYTVRSNKRHRFIELHDLLTSIESQRGRRLLHRKLTSREDIDRMFKKASKNSDFDTVNRTVGLYDTLGLYLQTGLVPRKLVLDNWGPTIDLSWPWIEQFILYRRDLNKDANKWQPLIWLAQQIGVTVSDELLHPTAPLPRG